MIYQTNNIYPPFPSVHDTDIMPSDPDLSQVPSHENAEQKYTILIKYIIIRILGGRILQERVLVGVHIMYVRKSHAEEIDIFMHINNITNDSNRLFWWYNALWYLSNRNTQIDGCHLVSRYWQMFGFIFINYGNLYWCLWGVFACLMLGNYLPVRDHNNIVLLSTVQFTLRKKKWTMTSQLNQYM